MLEDRAHPNHPAPSSASLRRESDREARRDDAIAFNATLVPLETQWRELREKLAAVVEKIGNHRERGYALAMLEDCDSWVAQILDAAKEAE